MFGANFYVYKKEVQKMNDLIELKLITREDAECLHKLQIEGKRSNPCTYKYSEKFDITIIIQLHKLYDFNKLYNSYNYHKFFRGL